MSTEETRVDESADDGTQPSPADGGEQRPRGARPAALVSGVAVCAGLPPWGWWPLTLVGLAAWVLLLERTLDRRRRFTLGYLAALGWYVPSTLWMVDFSPPGWALVVLAWFGPFAGLVSAMAPPDRRAALVLPAGLVLTAWLTAHAPFGGAPIATLAMTQAAGPLLPSARLGADLLVTLLVAGCASLGAAVVWRAWRGAAAGALAVLAVLLVAALAPGGGPVDGTIRVALVQGGGPQNTLAEDSDPDEVLARHLEATEQIEGPVDLIVWPENIVTLGGLLPGTTEDAELSRVAREHEATLVVGVTEHPDEDHFTNAAIVYGPDGERIDRYDKVRRVPFGEYVPMRWLFGPFSDLLPSRDQIPGEGPAVVDTPVGRMGVVVSWEVFFSRRARESVQHDGEVVLNPTNGSSYWLTIVQTQQVASSRLRAVETGRWVLQCAPTGLSAVVDDGGDVLQRTSVSEQAVLQAEVPLQSGRTLASRLGDLPAVVGALLLLLLAFARRPNRLRPSFAPSSEPSSPVPVITSPEGGDARSESSSERSG